jgi:hypothetical protein
MFEVGKDYEFSTGFGEHIGTHVAKVIEVEMPLIKVTHPRTGWEILNVHAPTFHNAKPVDLANLRDFEEF